MGRLVIAALAAAAVWPTPTAAEPADADPAFIADAPRSPARLRYVHLAGLDLALQARGRFARIDTDRRRAALEEAVEMGKVIPGYPQPAFLTVDLKVAF